MGSVGSLLHSKEPSTSPYPKPVPYHVISKYLKMYNKQRWWLLTVDRSATFSEGAAAQYDTCPLQRLKCVNGTVQRWNDWLTTWVAEWLIDWLAGWMGDWLTGWMADDWLAGWMADWLTVWLAGWLTPRTSPSFRHVISQMLTWCKKSIWSSLKLIQNHQITIPCTKSRTPYA